MVRVLRTIGFDRDWARTEGAYLYDADGERYLDWLGGFGMFNVGRNNPRVRDWLVEAMERQTPNAPQMGISPRPPLLAEELVAARRRRRSGRRSSRTAAPSRSRRRSSSAARRRGASASSRVEHGFHGLTLGSLSVNGEAAIHRPLRAATCRASRAVPFNDLEALERELAARGRRALHRRADPRQGRDPPGGRLPRAARRSSAAGTGRSSASTRCRPASAGPGSCSRASTGASSPT